MTPRQGNYRLRGRGSDLGIEVAGPDLVACLDAAVQGLAAAVGEVDAGAQRRQLSVEVTGGEATDLLVGVLDEAIALLDTEGLLAVRLVDAVVDPDGLRGSFDVVSLQAVSVAGPAPKAVTWHGIRLEDTGTGWEGTVTVDL